MAEDPKTRTPRSEPPQPEEARMAPGDEAPPGTPGTGEDVCPECNGDGRTDAGECAICRGRGKIVRGISAGP